MTSKATCYSKMLFSSWRTTQWFYYPTASLVAQTVKNLLAMQETPVWFLGQEDSLEKWIASHSCNLALRIPWTKEPGGLQSMESQRVRHDSATNTLLIHNTDKEWKWWFEGFSSEAHPKSISQWLPLGWVFGRNEERTWQYNLTLALSKLCLTKCKDF